MQDLPEPAPPVDLKPLAEKFGLRLLAAEWAGVNHRESSDFWSLQIPCKRGYIGTHSPHELSAVCTDRKFRKRLLTVPTVRVIDENEKYMRVAFDPICLNAIQAIMKARLLPRNKTGDVTTHDDDQSEE